MHGFGDLHLLAADDTPPLRNSQKDTASIKSFDTNGSRRESWHSTVSHQEITEKGVLNDVQSKAPVPKGRAEDRPHPTRSLYSQSEHSVTGFDHHGKNATASDAPGGWASDEDSDSGSIHIYSGSGHEGQTSVPAVEDCLEPRKKLGFKRMPSQMYPGHGAYGGGKQVATQNPIEFYENGRVGSAFKSSLTVTRFDVLVFSSFHLRVAFARFQVAPHPTLHCRMRLRLPRRG